ncbi:MAG TPA: SMP-30/gluconolactonase/LRE family protein [Gemmatimonadales bacterium]
MPTRVRALLLALSTLAACNRGSPPAQEAAQNPPAADSGSAAPALPSAVEGLKTPESVRYDPEQDVWFVSNINGDPLAKDGNGFISRLKGDGSVDSLHFIESGKSGVTLNAPKGMAITGDTLWVADIDAVRAFDRKSGSPLLSIDLKGKAKFLNDVVVGPDGIYITDSGFGPGMKTHPGPDQVFRVAGGKATVALTDAALAAPNGIAWDSAGGRFLIGPFAGKTIQAWTPGQKSLKAVGETPGQTDGLEVISGGRILFTSWADSTLDVLENGKVTAQGAKLASPADIGIDTKRGWVAIPQLMLDRVEFRPLPGSTP